MWGIEILETCELKQTLSHCCLKSRFGTKKIVDEVTDIKYLLQIVTLSQPCITSMLQILFEISTDSLQC